ncbi:4a-hydroxytetrahydrobiopterin dehydratase [Williamsia sp. CHRR-6]|uniref:4a-hydroxytetrahydrobiopterin dehydratase n=1 Tax=Williamsia sp. CHRR-6 TaxID=2835871 RepID=UPI0020253146|nr:4a-hydroxytetrahydrobiopterin dehydratase [Williamsia sp. CHRR-6]
MTAEEIERARAAAPTWTWHQTAAERSFQAVSFLDGVDFVRRVAEVAEAADHHPDIDIRWRTVRLEVSTHSAGGLTALDTSLIAAIERIVDELDGKIR